LLAVIVGPVVEQEIQASATVVTRVNPLARSAKITTGVGSFFVSITHGASIGAKASAVPGFSGAA
jgi:hypothetical protein